MELEQCIPSLETAGEVATAAEQVYGSDLRSTGVVHVMAAWQRDDGPLVTLRTGDGAPRCHHDALALGLARARADAIITTGEIVRREPTLHHDLPGPGHLPQALAAWRRQVLGKQAPPLLLVMTASGDVDLEHPAFTRAGRTVIYTSHRGAWALDSRAGDRGVELVVEETPTPRAAVALLRAQFGAATLLVEAGPSVAVQLYAPSAADDEEDPDWLDDDEDEDEDPETDGLGEAEPTPRLDSQGLGVGVEVDELMLTVLHRRDLETRFRGPRFLPRALIEKRLGRRVSARRVSADSGDWEISRYARLV